MKQYSRWSSALFVLLVKAFVIPLLPLAKLLELLLKLPEDLDAKLEENNRKLLRDVEDLLDEKEDKEKRQKYD